ncbi:COG4705 family protein [Curtobacterium sp. AB451]|uniref:COG4705 family protein n=1 Tax=unclassified Curtobacterium TaxID=257496 RepID=UPI0003B7A80F|nr:membrane protein [Curtobacterium sp. B18]
MPRSTPAHVATVRNKVPDPTASFWIVKVLATTVGETAADLMSETLGLGLPLTTVVMGAVLVLFLVLQFRARSYRPSVYWVTVVLISIVGTCITDNLTDGLGVPLWLSTTVFGVGLVVVFLAWHRVEGTLSIHRIDTVRREAFYWLAILFTFALGTAAGDLIGEQTGIGYFPALLLFAGGIALVALLRFGLRVDGVACFWAAYVLTRPLGASLGDLLSQPTSDGGLGIGTITTSTVFLAAILVVVGATSVRLRRSSAALTDGSVEAVRLRRSPAAD